MEVKTISDVTIIKIIARVDATNAKTVEMQLSEIVSGGTKKIVCDFSENQYISSAGLRVFLATLKMLKKINGEIVLCGLQTYVQEVFDMAGFSQLFKIYSTEDEALQGM